MIYNMSFLHQHIFFQHEIMSLDKQLTYPLYISVNMQLVTPLALEEETTSADVVFSDT